jgi:hypothetical protein
MKMRFLALCGLLCFISTAIIINCKNKDNPVATTPSGILSEKDIYSTTGNKLAIKSEPIIRIYCSDSTLAHDTSEGYSDTIEYIVSNNRLEFILEGTDTLSSGAIVKDEVMAFTRKGSGSGIKDVWILTNYEYKLLYGIPTADEIATLNEHLDNGRKELIYEKTEIEFTDNNMLVYITKDFAAEFIRDWNEDIDGSNQTMIQTDTGWALVWDSDSTIYNIKVEEVNSFTAKLTGNISGEIVTITWNEKRDKTYTSSNPVNLAHTYYLEPTVCPNLLRPNWYYTFKTANKKASYPYKLRSKDNIITKSNINIIGRFENNNSYKILGEK